MSLQLSSKHSQNGCLSQLSTQILSTIFDCLSEQELECFVVAFGKGKKFRSLCKIAKFRLAFVQFYHKADRSYHFGIFAEPSFLKTERRTLSSIALNPVNAKITQFPNKFISYIKKAQHEVCQTFKQQFGEKLKQLFTDPCLPMPKLLRQTINSDINSVFQNFLASQSIQSSNSSFTQQVFASLKETIEDKQQQIILSMMNNQSAVKQIRQSPHQITHNQIDNSLIDGNQLHNLIVYILGLTDVFLNGIEEYLGTIQNDFDLLLHLTSKYCQFQSTVINMEESLGFLFKNYGELYEQIFNTRMGKFNFWRPAFTMWIKKMNKFHEKTNLIYASLLQSNINQTFEKYVLSEKYQKIYSKISNNLKSEIQAKSQNYQLMKENMQIEALVNSYQQYLVDISINENLVHQCGHSHQKVDIMFMEAQHAVLDEEQIFISSLKCEDFKDDDDQILLQSILRQRLQNFSLSVKPRTAKQLIQLYSIHNISIRIPKLEMKDKQIDRYLESINYVSKDKIEQFLSIALDCTQKSEIETASCDESDKQFEFYESENEMEAD